MTDSNIELTRRKILGGLGAVGAAGVGAGLGTSALFSDNESIGNNTIVAGSLDLKVDWEEHYSYPQLYFEGRDPETGSDTTRSTPGDVSGYRAFPPGIEEAGGSPLLWVNEDDVGDYMDATAIDAFPDIDDDGAQDTTVDAADGPFAGENSTVYNPCLDGADLDEDLSSSLRSNNDATGPGDPLIALEDVKPGDFGEVTFSTHLCDNDAYLWLCGELVEAAENGNPEPEENEPEDTGPATETTSDPTVSDDVELLDEVQTALWYDDSGDAGNNLVDEQMEELDLVVAVDVSGSIDTTDKQDALIEGGEALAEAIADQADVWSSSVDGDGADVEVGLLLFGGGSVSIPVPLGPADPFFTTPGDETTPDLGSFIDGTDFGGNTPMAGALAAAQYHLDNAGRSGAEKTIVMATDGGPNYDSSSYTVNVSGGGSFTVPTSGSFTGGSSSPGGTVQQSEMQETADVAAGIRGGGTNIIAVGILTDSQASGSDSNLQSPDPVVNGTPYGDLNDYLEAEIAGGGGNYYNVSGGFSAIPNIASKLAEQITSGDEVFFTGSLRDALINLEDCIPLDGDRSTAFDELSGDEDDANRDPYIAEKTHYIGFSWWVPTTVGNEIQSDKVTFDLGFFAQQARNNDGIKSS